VDRVLPRFRVSIAVGGSCRFRVALLHVGGSYVLDHFPLPLWAQ